MIRIAEEWYITPITSDTWKKGVLSFSSREDYLLKNCQITSFDISTSPNGSYTSTIDIIAEDYSPAIIDIEFKDGIRKIPYRHYFNQVDYLDYDEHNKSKFKGMTYEEFMDRVMVDEL